MCAYQEQAFMIVSTFSVFQQLWQHGACPQKAMAPCPFSPCSLPCLYGVFHPVFEPQRLRQTGLKGVSYCFFGDLSEAFSCFCSF